MKGLTLKLILIGLCLMMAGCDKSPDEIFGISNDVEVRTDNQNCKECHGR